MRININYVLDSSCEKWSRNINKELSKLSTNEINFSSGLFRPHITLLMGEINEADFVKIKQIVEEFKSNSLNKKINFDKPYIKGPYIFMDVKDSTTFKKDCDNLLLALNGLIVPHKHLISNGNPPHITLGYIKKTEEISDYVNSINDIPSSILQNINVSKTGIHGTVICDGISTSHTISDN